MSRFAASAALAALLLANAGLASATAAQPADASQLLDDQRWQEQSYGLSVLPPAGARQVEQTASGALVNFVADDYNIEVFIHHDPNRLLDVNELKREAISRFGFAYPSARVLEDERLTINGRPVALLYYRVGDDAGDWVLGQAMMLIEPQTAALFEFETDAEAFDQTREVFQAVLQSADFADPRLINAQRAEWLDRGHAWLKSLQDEDIAAANPAEQWLRVTENGRDVGYIRLTREEEEVLGEPGVQVTVQSRIFTGPAAFDSLGEFMESHDEQLEIWGIRTTQRSDARTSGGARGERTRPVDSSWRELGRRAGGRITVERELPTRITESDWAVPPTAYLSQVDLHSLWPLLPRSEKTTMAFYAYYANTGELALRTVTVEPQPDGGYLVRERPAPNRAEQVSIYDARGRLLERRMADGRVIVPASAQQIRAIWQDR